MRRTLFTLAAALSLLLCLASVGTAVWASSTRASTYVARNGRIWDVGHWDGNVMVWTTLWPRDEPMVTRSTSMAWQRGWGFEHYDLGVIIWMRGPSRALPGLLDPWGRIPPLTAAPAWAIGLRFWRLAMLFAVLPAAWVLWRFRFARVSRPGSGVDPVPK